MNRTILKSLLTTGLLAALVSPLHASTLDLTRTKLRELGATTPLAATLDHQVTGKTENRDEERGRVTVRIEARDGELSISHTRESLREVAAEQRDPDPDRSRPTTRAIDSVEASKIAGMIDFAPRLLRDLEGATIVRQSRVRRNGVPSTLLELDLEVRLSEESKKRIKSAESTMKLWVDESGVPIASEKRSSLSGRILVIRFSGSENEDLEYQVAGDRFVVTRAVHTSEGSGFGQSVSESTRTTLAIDN